MSEPVPINESIVVAGVYCQAKFEPRWFEWRQNRRAIQRVTTYYDANDGGVRYRYYSVQAAGGLYRLKFNRDQETWQLAAIWSES